MPDEQIVELFEKKVLDLRNSQLSYYFVIKFGGADIKAHQQVIIESTIDRTGTVEKTSVIRK